MEFFAPQSPILNMIDVVGLMDELKFPGYGLGRFDRVAARRGHYNHARVEDLPTSYRWTI